MYTQEKIQPSEALTERSSLSYRHFQTKVNMKPEGYIRLGSFQVESLHTISTRSTRCTMKILFQSTSVETQSSSTRFACSRGVSTPIKINLSVPIHRQPKPNREPSVRLTWMTTLTWTNQTHLQRNMILMTTLIRIQIILAWTMAVFLTCMRWYPPTISITAIQCASIRYKRTFNRLKTH